MLQVPGAVSICILLVPPSLSAQAFVPLRGEGTVTIGYQYTNVHDHLEGDGTEFRAGRIYSNSLSAQLDYGITDKLAASFSVPYITSRYRGLTPHNPATLAIPHDEVPLVDDGSYNGTFQDLGFGVRYNLTLRPFAISPFIAANLPSHDYPFYAHTAIGRNLRQLNLGVNVGGQSEQLLPKSYFHVRYSYGITERTEVAGTSYGGNQSLLRGDFGFFLSQRLIVKAIQVLQITHGGLDYPSDFPDRTGELWLHHDQVQSIDYLEMGGGIDFAISPRMDASVSALKSAWGHNGHALRIGLAVGVTWYFPRPVR